MTQGVADRRTTWKALAACRTVPTEVFFDADMIPVAKQVCAACVSRAACLDANLFEGDGVFGGLSANERKVLVRKLQPSRTRVRRTVLEGEDPLAGTGRKHGTASGYALCSCVLCKKAKAERVAARRKALQSAGLEMGA